VAVALVGIGAIIGFVTSDPGSGHINGLRTLPSVLGSDRDIAPIERKYFPVLDRPVDPSEGLPAAVIREHSSPTDALRTGLHIYLILNRARKIVIAQRRVQAWFIPGRNGFCMYAASTGGRSLGEVCDGVRYLARTLVVGSSLDPAPGGGVAVGLVTDRVAAITLLSGRDRRAAVSVHDGIYVLRYRFGYRVVFSALDGRRVVENFDRGTVVPRPPPPRPSAVP